jgi:hypothetical protein
MLFISWHGRGLHAYVTGPWDGDNHCQEKDPVSPPKGDCFISFSSPFRLLKDG